MCVSDLVLVLGLGGAAAYLWRTAVPGPRDQGFSQNSSSFLHWLFAEDKLTGDVLRNTVRAKSRRGATNIQNQLMLPGDDSDSGLNILVTNKNRPEKFLKQKLFDLRQIRDTSRFRELSCDSERSRCESRLGAERPARCGLGRGLPDGEERLEAGEENRQHQSEKEIFQKIALSEDRPQKASSGMKSVLKNARDIRRLIREGSFDSLTSDFSLDLDFKLDIENDPADEDDDNDVTITDDKDDYVLDKKLFERFESNQMWRITNSTRESSLVSDYSYNLKNERQLNVLGGYSSDDLASLIGSQADALEWDDDCFMNEDLFGGDTATVHSAWLPDYDQELDLESELFGRRLMSPSPGVLSVEGERKPWRDMKHLTRLPPSGASSVESLCEKRQELC